MITNELENPPRVYSSASAVPEYGVAQCPNPVVLSLLLLPTITTITTTMTTGCTSSSSTCGSLVSMSLVP